MNRGARQPGTEDCEDFLHGLNNVLVSVLLSAQVIEWKLPSYSQFRRNLHEIERSARRGSDLVVRLRNCLASLDPAVTGLDQSGFAPDADGSGRKVSSEDRSVGG